MDVLQYHKDFLTRSVSMKVLLKALCDQEVLKYFDYDNIMALCRDDDDDDDDCEDGHHDCEDMFLTNRKMFEELLKCFGRYDDCSTCLYTAFNIIKSQYPDVAIHIPAIQLGLRFRAALGPNTMLTVCNIQDGDYFEVGIDLRKMKVSNS